MTEQQVSLVKNSWKIIQAIDPVLVGDVFYGKLFMTAPRLKHMFHLSTEEQSKKLVEMLSIIVGRLDRMSELTEDIRQLAIRHEGYGVKPEHYAVVGTALLWMLEQGLGKDWNKDVKGAWEKCYAVLSATMINTTRYTRQDNT
ncbi:MAG: hemoglobin [Ferruginibacter sp.]|nr:hemoglobin [Ferruginibacter sp.]